jgi:hypothetical protein
MSTILLHLAIITVSALAVDVKSDTSVPYMIIGLSTMMAFTYHLVHGNRNYEKVNTWGNRAQDKKSFSLVIYLPLLVIISWIYGVCLGILRNVPPEHVFRNFAGLFSYCWFYALIILRPSFHSILLSVLISSIIQIYYGFVVSIKLLADPYVIFAGESISEARVSASAGMMVIFPLIAIGIIPKKNLIQEYGIDKKVVNILKIIKHPLFFTICCYTVIVPYLSKGFMLSFFILVLYTIFQFGYIAVRKGFVSKEVVMLAILLIVMFFVIPPDVSNILLNSFSDNEYSNAIRAEQVNKLVNEFTFFGSGLGAPLMSGYSREDTGYGFELTYLNLIHKLGFFAIPLFLYYVTIVVGAIRRINQSFYLIESFFVLGCMAYLIPSSSNPFLLSPQSVVMHCIATYVYMIPFINPVSNE